MQLAALTRPDLIFPALEAHDRTVLLRVIAQRLHDRGVVHDAADLFQRLEERESLASTGIGGGVAVPHCKLDKLSEIVLAIAMVQGGVDFDAPDEQPARLFFVIISPSHEPAAHLQCLAAISKWVQGRGRVEHMLRLDSPEAIHQLLEEGDT